MPDEREAPRAIWVDGELLTVPVVREVQEALGGWLDAKHGELVAVLAPFDLHPFELQLPTFRRVVQAKDVADAVDA